MIRKLLIALVLLIALPVYANAATCFWVGGTGNYNDATHWSSGTGGAGSTCAATSGIPKNAVDIATLDGLSGAGTVSLDIDISIDTLILSAHTGTFDATTHNITLGTQLISSGAATHTILCGTGTWTFTGTGTVVSMGTTTNTTFTCSSSTWSFVATNVANRSLLLGSTSLTFGTVSIGANTSGGDLTIQGSAAGTTFGTFNVSAPNAIDVVAGRPLTITNGLSWAGTSSAQISLVNPGSYNNNPASRPTINIANSTCSWCFIRANAFAGGGNFTATNSFDGGANTISGGGTLSITGPSAGGGGGFIIGGG